ncbi:putative receptor-like protein kinase At3g47110 [Tasmannia lanceolata]|uniref:putative receptor-like protein kinase At3g47110 n=1 Tax=Tasmannia lanceolata TaxID=3420 RepID=UPI0040628131
MELVLPHMMNIKLIWSFLLLPTLFFSINILQSKSSSFSTTQLGNETDRLALLAFKQMITDDPRGFLSSWNHSVHLCNWNGVTCSRRHHQRVTVLDLNSQSLVGSLSPHVTNLSFLRTMNLSYNNFHGEIPVEIGHLSRLRYLHLFENSFSGKVPSELKHCSNLRSIDLNTNDLSGIIPVEIGSLTKLTLLHLYKNNLIGSIPPSLGNLSSLKVLSLESNELEGSIPDELGQILNLGFLQISQNKLSGTIPPLLYNLSSLYLFSVSANQLHGNLPPNLGLTLPNVKLLLMGNNLFTGPIPISLSNASGLEQIWFTYNALSGSVPMNLGSLQGLSVLGLGNNQLGTGESDDLSFISTLRNCSELKTLQLLVNRFGGVLPASLANLSKQLDWLTVGENRICGTIPAGIESLVNLTVLIMNQNLLTGTIPIGIGKLQKLNYLDLSENKLSGEIPWSIGNITMQFNKLFLEGNELSGRIPWSLGNCQKLVLLSLSRNNLNGTIPKQVIGLSSLIYLVVFQNSMTGSLPLEVGNLKNLQVLSVPGNKLSGEIPDTLGDCQSLEYLYMGNNFFNGPIPSSLSNLKGIRDLDLSCNNLSGQIPKILDTNRVLENLNLSFNSLEGEVPQQGAFGNASTISIQGNKMLCGGIKNLKLPHCPTTTSKIKGRFGAYKVIILIPSLVLFLLLLLCFLAILHRTRKSRHGSFSAISSLEGYLKVSYKELLKATDGFSLDNLIGAGSYGSVYKGILDCYQTIVAVKVLNLEQHGARRSFNAECEALRNIRHRNLVKILTCCSSVDYSGNDFKAIVFEYMPNGSLEKWLHPKEDGQHNLRNLKFIQRLEIAIDVASALEYLHHHCGTPIVHGDLKPSNVLLGHDMVAHVGDFGSSRFLSEITNNLSQSQTSSIGLKGSIGYIAPEYGTGGPATSIGDVYSYGIILLEMFTGKGPTDEMFKDGLDLHKFTMMSLPERVMKIVDPVLLVKDEDNQATENIKNDFNKRRRMQEGLVSVLKIGVMCSIESPRERMEMADVVKEIKVMREIFLGDGIHGDGRHNSQLLA